MGTPDSNDAVALLVVPLFISPGSDTVGGLFTVAPSEISMGSVALLRVVSMGRQGCNLDRFLSKTAPPTHTWVSPDRRPQSPLGFVLPPTKEVRH